MPSAAEPVLTYPGECGQRACTPPPTSQPANVEVYPTRPEVRVHGSSILREYVRDPLCPLWVREIQMHCLNEAPPTHSAEPRFKHPPYNLISRKPCWTSQAGASRAERVLLGLPSFPQTWGLFLSPRHSLALAAHTWDRKKHCFHK